MKKLLRIFNAMILAIILVFAGFSSVFAAPSNNGTVDWCDLCPKGGMWNPNINDCEECVDAGYDSDTCTCRCEWGQEYVPGVGCRPSDLWCEFNCKEYGGTWDPLTHSCSGSEKCYDDGQYYDDNICECACEKGVYNPTTHQCDEEEKNFCDGECVAPEFVNEEGKCEICINVPGVSYYDPGSCQCRCTQEGYQYQFDEKTGTAGCVPDGGGSGQTSCEAGYYWDPKGEKCHPCSVGYYNDTPGASDCTKCPGG